MKIKNHYWCFILNKIGTLIPMCGFFLLLSSQNTLFLILSYILLGSAYYFVSCKDFSIHYDNITLHLPLCRIYHYSNISEIIFIEKDFFLWTSMKVKITFLNGSNVILNCDGICSNGEDQDLFYEYFQYMKSTFANSHFRESILPFL
jgi:hypothetical protein